jgi:hypothetical protein
MTRDALRNFDLREITNSTSKMVAKATPGLKIAICAAYNSGVTSKEGIKLEPGVLARIPSGNKIPLSDQQIFELLEEGGFLNPQFSVAGQPSITPTALTKSSGPGFFYF